MSAFSQGTGMNAQMMASYTDLRLPKDNWGPVWNVALLNPWADAVLWPSSRWSGGANAFFGDGGESNRWAPQAGDDGGGQQMLKFIGTTKDQAGNVLGSAVVQAILTSNDLFLRQVTSDAAGYFELPSEYAGQGHYLVAYKAGSPDVAGTTVNTLQPA